MKTGVSCLAALLLAADASACTTFCIRDGSRLVFGQNYDWYVAEGAVLVNKREAIRMAYAPGDRALTWTSRHGSVTFNQYGRNQPTGGMNEAGLVVALMWVNGTAFPAPDARPAVGGGTGWIQYQLDSAASVAEVVASDAHVRIPRSGTPLHYLVADRGGEVAVIEFREGRMVVNADGGPLAVAALENDFYADSLAAYRKSPSAQSRFARAAGRMSAYRPGMDPIQYAFDTLEDVAQGSQAIAPAPPAHVTQWSIVYDIDRLQVHFRTRARPATKTLALAGLEFSCASPVTGIDVHQADGGDVASRLRPFTRADNLALIRATWAQTAMLKSAPQAELERVASLADKLACHAAGR